MRTFQSLLFLTLLFATALADPHGSVGGDVEEREILARAGSCLNNHQSLTAPVGKCDPDQSKGFLSAHNCKNKGGKYYYCVGKSDKQCLTIKNAVGLENGECFL